jgi:ferredoxin-NADP reductase
LQGGRFSEWLHDELKVGDSIMVSEPRGHCFYLPERSEQGLLLIGTGTGLAPLQGILMDALKQGHSGAIHLFHSSREVDDLYHLDEMRSLATHYPNFFYTPCISGKQVPEGFISGRANDIALAALPDLKGWRVFLCGNPQMVNQTKRQAFMKGASMADIYADAFVLSHAPTTR